MALVEQPMVVALGAALLVGAAFVVGRYTFGDDDPFDEVGTTRTGVVTILATFVVVWGLLSMDTLLSGSPFVTAEVIAGTLTVFLGAVLVMNRGRIWFVNILAQKEPALIGLGVGVFLLFNNELAMLVGVGLIALGLVSRFTGVIDI